MCSGYSEPQLAIKRTPKVVLVTKNVDNDNWREAGFICYSCNEWPSIHEHSTSQPWIWAANVVQPIESATVDHSIFKHNTFGMHNTIWHILKENF